MFVPLRPAEMVTAIGRAARAAGRADGEPTEFQRGQLMSAYSATRHLAVELDHFGPERERLRHEVAAALTAAVAALPPGDPARERLSGLLAAPDDAGALGEDLSVLLAECREHTGEPWATLQTNVHGGLRVLCDREVSLLSEVIEAARA
jgi:hypothetical protein